MTGSFNCLGHFTLVLQRGTGQSTGQNFSLLIQKLLQELRIFVIHVLDFVFLEAAVLFLFNLYRRRSKISDFALILCHGLVLLFFFFVGSSFLTVLKRDRKSTRLNSS